MELLTKEQIYVLEQIKEYIDENGYSPSIRELCKITGKSSPATIHYYLKVLKQKGFIEYREKRNRTIRVIKDFDSSMVIEKSKKDVKEYNHNYYLRVTKEKRKQNGNDWKIRNIKR